MTDESVWKIIDWMCRECAPKWLDAAGLTIDSAALRDLAPLTSAADAVKAAPALQAARDSSRTLWTLVQRKAPASDAASAATGQVLSEAMRDVGWAAAGSKDTWGPEGLIAASTAMHAAWYSAGVASVFSSKEEDPDQKVRTDADAVLQPARDELRAAAVTLQAALDKSATADELDR